MTRDESRQVAQKRLADLIALLQKMPAAHGTDDLVVEGESLRRAIDAFHLEGIRFRTTSWTACCRACPACRPRRSRCSPTSTRRSKRPAATRGRTDGYV